MAYIETNEVVTEGMTDFACVVEAATDDRYGRHWSNDVAIRLLNQIGVQVSKKLLDVADLLEAVGEDNLNIEQILECYNLDSDALEITALDIERMLAIGREHCLTVEARKIMSDLVILDLDSSYKLSQYRGAFGRSLVEELERFAPDGEARWIAFFSPLEAYFKIRQNEHNHCSYEQVAALIIWCREVSSLPVDFWKKGENKLKERLGN